MRITTCAYEAAGKRVRASNSANTVFFMANRILLGFECLPESYLFSGVSFISTFLRGVVKPLV